MKNDLENEVNKKKAKS